jgi:hypothetical protein
VPAAGDPNPDLLLRSNGPDRRSGDDRRASLRPQQEQHAASLRDKAQRDASPTPRRQLQLLLVAAPRHRATPDVKGLVAFLENGRFWL